MFIFVGIFVSFQAYSQAVLTSLFTLLSFSYNSPRQLSSFLKPEAARESDNQGRNCLPCIVLPRAHSTANTHMSQMTGPARVGLSAYTK